jgi:hypothetical protein
MIRFVKDGIFLFSTFEADSFIRFLFLASIRFVVFHPFLSLQLRFVPAFLIVFSRSSLN